MTLPSPPPLAPVVAICPGPSPSDMGARSPSTVRGADTTACGCLIRRGED